MNTINYIISMVLGAGSLIADSKELRNLIKNRK